MKVSDFDYTYPKDLVAQRPLARRGSSRMMVVDRAKGCVSHRCVAELADALCEGDLIVANDSRVIPARLFGMRGNGQPIELLLVENAEGTRGDHHVWRCLLKKAKRLRPGEKFFFGMQSTATARGMDENFLLVEFQGNSLDTAIRHHGVPPLPPYIDRQSYEAYTDEDRERYQTVYARRPGSVAAPTAGLHFDEAMLAALKGRGISIAYITLHIGVDTFEPVRDEDISEHRMHGERVEISQGAAQSIIKAKDEGRRIVAIGTTTARALESAVDDSLHASRFTLHAGSRTTDLFIKPGYKFKMVDALLTNFHQPKSTLLMLVAAFAGREFILSCYEEAIRKRYRLFSYGDCMLIV